MHITTNAIHNGPASLHAAAINGNDEGALHDAVMGHVKDLHSKIAASAAGANQPAPEGAQQSTAAKAARLFNSAPADGDGEQAGAAPSKADKAADRKRRAGEIFKK